MAFNALIPQPTDKLKDSQNDILNNFQSLNTAWNINHYSFDAPNNGKHTNVVLPEQTVVPTTAANELAVYSQESTRTSVAELFIRRESNGDEIEFTSSLQATPGWMILPSGMIVKWGESTQTGSANVVLPDDGDVLIPRFSTMFSVQLTVSAAGGTDVNKFVRVTDISNPLQIGVYASLRTLSGADTATFQYLAIGV